MKATTAVARAHKLTRTSEQPAKSKKANSNKHKHINRQTNKHKRKKEHKKEGTKERKKERITSTNKHQQYVSDFCQVSEKWAAVPLSFSI